MVSNRSLIKKEKKRKFSSYIMKFRWDRFQSHKWLKGSSVIIYGLILRISSHRKPFLIWLCTPHPIWISLYMRKIFFSFWSVWTEIDVLVCLFCCRLFFDVIPFPPSKTILIGLVLMNRQNAANCWLCFPFWTICLQHNTLFLLWHSAWPCACAIAHCLFRQIINVFSKF